MVKKNILNRTQKGPLPKHQLSNYPNVKRTRNAKKNRLDFEMVPGYYVNFLFDMPVRRRKFN